MNHPEPNSDALLDVVRELASELHPARRTSVTLDSTLDRDIGLDSLGRVELVLRVERRFGMNLPEGTLVNAETPRDLLNAVFGARTPKAANAALEEPSAISPIGTAAPEHARTIVEALDWHLQSH